MKPLKTVRRPFIIIVQQSRWLAVALCSFLAVSPVAFAMDDVEQARSLLKKMVSANRELDYQGIFTYEHAGTLKSIRIVHVVRDQREYEKLLYLNGPRKELVRRGVPLHCKQSGDKFLRGMATAYSSNLENHYELFLRGEDRIADREVKIIQVAPKDAMRYGYILSVDKASGLLLQSLLVGVNGRVMERFQYVDLSLAPSDAAVDELVLSGNAGADGCETEAVSTEASPWRATWLPPGFELAGSGFDEDGNASLSYTDGLSFVSVFIDGANGGNFPEIQAQRGATVAQLAKVNHQGKDYTVCVVGEVPPETAARIAKFVAPRQP